VAATAALVASVSACGAGHIVTPVGSTASAPVPSDGYVASNVLRADYAGSDACQPCHADVYRAWRDSPESEPFKEEVRNYEFRSFVGYLGLRPVPIPDFQMSMPIESAGCDPDSGVCLP